ncbi:MAG TPA: DUF4136 domain-containing protein [Campylobacterales bacterium]|nr:DUF4136 domain-containing protein [Campylobacterales bacterium]HHS92397.1 DUF4136 domain-containing protein [Campylobacterales bacterium]
MKKVLLILLSVTTFFLTGCTVTPKYKISIDAITNSNNDVKPSTYTLKSLNKNIDENSLLFQRYSKDVEKALQQKGYVKANANQIAQQFIYFDYGIDKVDEHTETYTEPDISFHVGWGYPYYHPFYRPFYGGGYTTYRETRIYYNRYITLLAKDALDKELWRVDVSSVGESKNLQKIIPILIKAATPYIGTNTADPVEIVVQEKAKKK